MQNYFLFEKFPQSHRPQMHKTPANSKCKRYRWLSIELWFVLKTKVNLYYLCFPVKWPFWPSSFFILHFSFYRHLLLCSNMFHVRMFIFAIINPKYSIHSPIQMRSTKPNDSIRRNSPNDMQIIEIKIANEDERWACSHVWVIILILILIQYSFFFLAHVSKHVYEFRPLKNKSHFQFSKVPNQFWQKGRLHIV